MYIVSSTGKTHQMEVNDVSKPFIIIHPIVKLELTNYAPQNELENSTILKSYIQDGSLIKYFDPDKYNGYSEDNFPLNQIVPISEILDNTGETSTAIGDKTFIHNQLSFSTSWLVTHNLGKFVSADVENENGEIIDVSWRHLNLNQILVEPDIPIKGKVYCN